MTPLETLIRQHIAAHGPMPFADYMAWCLFHPQHGYYTTHDPLGEGGDFVTSPEISQIFGEMIALWCIHTWMQMGRPTPFTLLECGPGRGTLMQDVLRGARAMPDFLAAAKIVLLEKSPVLKAKQQEALKNHACRWVEEIGQIPVFPTIMFCNEFFDAFPVERMAKTGTGWTPQMVLVENDTLTLAPPAAGDGTIMETSAAIEGWVKTFAAHLAEYGGAALIVDYAYEGPRAADSVQAMRRHKYVDILDAPGTSDLTAYVDYAAIMTIAGRYGLRLQPVITQRDFLLQFGLEARLKQLKTRATPEQAAELESGAARLIDTGGMGTMFRVLSFMKA